MTTMTDQRELLRFATAGSVDDGKSTLIGRLLHDAKVLFDDTLDAVARSSAARGRDGLDLSLVTDGLRAEREQGITIDVAYRYFATPRRSFVVIDSPGHVQYTRNMVTGASNADAAVILVDARHGISEQTRRHLTISALLGLHHVVLAVNKMDLVSWSEPVFTAIETEFRAIASELQVPEVTAIPISALTGDNVVDPSLNLPWYHGRTVLHVLETLTIPVPSAAQGLRLPIQWVIVPAVGQAGDDQRRRYAGTVAAGTIRPGDEVVVLPGGQRTTVVDVGTADGPLDEAVAGQAISVVLDDHLDGRRGSVIASVVGAPSVTTRIEATVCWMTDRPLTRGTRLLAKHTTVVTPAFVVDVVDRLDVTTLVAEPADALGLNDLGTVRLELADPIAADRYDENRTTGSFILIDPVTDSTVGAGLIREVGVPALI